MTSFDLKMRFNVKYHFNMIGMTNSRMICHHLESICFHHHRNLRYDWRCIENEIRLFKTMYDENIVLQLNNHDNDNDHEHDHDHNHDDDNENDTDNLDVNLMFNLNFDVAVFERTIESPQFFDSSSHL